MDQNEEYHDPDYPEIPVVVKKEALELSEHEKIEKIKSIIRREFSNELEIRENEVMLIEQRMSTSRRLLQRLRYALVCGYYRDQKLQLSASHIDDDVAQMEPRARVEVLSILREGQRRLHPSVRKLLGKQTVDLQEIIMSRPLRNKTRKNYSAMVQTRNYTIPADTTKSLRPEPKLELEESNPEPGCSKPRKTPRHLEPRQQKVITFDDPTRNQTKHRYRLIIGNTSKYAPGASSADRSTHKWLLYVRGPAAHATPGPVLTHLVARLHHSYAPHHTVRLTKPPFHISRRGWGEFPARLELHFPLPARNRPACLEHTIKLDRNYTGLQTLGAETIVDVWLYSTPEMLEYEYFDPIPAAIEPADPPTEPTTDIPTEETEIQPKIEPIEYDTTEQTDDWMEFFSKDTTELDVDEMIIKPVKKEIVEEEKVTNDVENMINANIINKDEEPTIKTESDWCVTELEDIPQVPEEIVNQPSTPKKRIMKYIDSTTRKIYYLEMDRTLDLSKVQEIVINNSKIAKISPVKSNGLKNVRKRKGGVSLLKPEVKNQLKSDNFKDKPLVKKNFTHIENDHCYLGNNWCWKPINSPVLQDDSFSVASEVKEKSLYDNLCSAMCSFTCVRGAVNYMLKKMPVITECARDVDFVRKFPFVVENEERYWKLDFAKRRNIEWSRAKLINRLLTEHFTHTEQIWRTKQILIYSRLHGYNPIRPDPVKRQPESDEWSSWNDMDCTRQSESNIKAVFPNASDICLLTVFNSEDYLNCTQTDSIENLDSDEEVDIESSDPPVKVRHNVSLDCSGSELTVLPVQNEDDRLRFMFIEQKCADIGVELRNEDVGNGCSYSAVHAVLLSAVKCFAEELIRGALAEKLTEDVPEDALPPVWIGSSRSVSVGAAHAWRAAGGRLRPALAALGKRPAGATDEKL